MMHRTGHVQKIFGTCREVRDECKEMVKKKSGINELMNE